MCPSLGPIVPVPGAAILSGNDPVCQSPTGAVSASVGQQNNQGPIERIQAAITTTEGLVNQGLVSAGVLEGMRRILVAAQNALANGLYAPLNGYAAAAERAVSFAQQHGTKVRDVEALSSRWFVSGTIRRPDIVVDMVETLANGSTIDRVVMVEVKNWRWGTLNSARGIAELQRQIQASLTGTNYRVVVEFVETKTAPIPLTPAQIANHLGLQQLGIDLTRVEIRKIPQAIGQAVADFVPLVPTP
jgi:hypothetical protein